MVEGVTELLVPEMVLVPTALVAVTVNVYVVPLLNPVIVIGEFPPVAVKPPEFDVDGVVRDRRSTRRRRSKANGRLPIATGRAHIVGALGVVAGVTELLVPEIKPVPIAFVAVTVNVYVVPFVRPVTVIGLPVELAVNPPTFEEAGSKELQSRPCSTVR